MREVSDDPFIYMLKKWLSAPALAIKKMGSNEDMLVEIQQA